MSMKKIRPSHHFMLNKNKRITNQLLNVRQNICRTPSPENILLVNNKLDMLDSFKYSFTKKQSNSRYATPIQKSQPRLPDITLTSLNVNNYGLGDSRARILSSALKSLKGLKTLNMKGNNMNETGASSILDSINRNKIKKLDLSSNRLGILGIESISEILLNDYCILLHLNLENTRPCQKSLSLLCSALKRNKTLKTLNLANNKIGPNAGLPLSDLLDYNNTLLSLDLQWNFLKGEDLVIFTSSLKNNTSLKTLDLSWNSIGHDKITRNIHQFSINLFLNDTLIHLNLSHNNFTYQDCVILSENIKPNQTIQGLHLEGNYAMVNALGFIVPTMNISRTRLQQTSRIVSKHLKASQEMCWICNDWTDVTIEWNPSRVVWNRRLKHFAFNKLESQREPVYVHLEIDDFQPFLLSQSEFGVYKCVRALPRGKFRGIAQISNEYAIEPVEPAVERFVHFYGTFSKSILAVVLNHSNNEGTRLESVPRPRLEDYVPPPGDVPELDIPPWVFENSIFSTYIQDTPDLLNKCFEADWANSKLPRFLKSETTRIACKELIRKEYQKIYYNYKYLSGLNMNSSIFSVTLNTLTDIFQKNNVIDKVFKLSDLDLNIKACTNNSSSTHINSAFSVVRHEFLELQVRVGVDKLFRTGVCRNEAEALNRFFSMNFKSNYEENEWRRKRYYNEECDSVLMANKDFLSLVFENWKGKYSRSADKKGLAEEDFIGMMQEHGFFNERFTQRYGCVCFHLALMTKVDEINSNAYMCATFVEFLEAFARVCDLVDSQDPEKDINIGWCFGEVSLDKKIENALASFAYLKNKRRVR